jgi:serine/threonine protein kinase
MTTEPPSQRSARFVGTMIAGRYRVLHVVEERAREILFACDDMAAGARVGIGILPAGSIPDATAQDRVGRESAVAERVRHPSIAAGHDPGALPDGSRFFILPDIERSTSLRRAMAAGPMPLPRATSIIRQIALALEALHSADIVHRALTPEIIRLFPNEPGVSGRSMDRVILTGFGAAQLGPDEAGPALDPTSLLYASPELSSGRPVDKRSDFYALGVLFYELVTGSRPQRGQAQPAPSMTSIRSVPVAVDALALRLISDDPSRRASVAMDVVRALDALSETAPQTPIPPPPSAPRISAVPATARSRLGETPTPAITGLPSVNVTRATQPTSPTLNASKQGSLAPGFGGLPAQMRLYLIGTVAITFIIIIAIAVRPSWSESEGRPPQARSTAAAAPKGPATPMKPTKSDPPPTSEPEAAGAKELRARLDKSSRQGQASAFVTDLERLLEIEPQAAEEREIKNAIIEVLMRIMISDSPHIEPLFKVVQDKMGTAGPDLLYELLTTRGGSKAAKRADELLRDEAVRSRGSPAMRIAYDLRTAKTCDAKRALYERAGEEGDRRTLGQLFVLSRECGSNDPKLKAALEALKKRHP